MQVIFYSCADDRRTVNKTLTQITTADCDVWDSCNIKDPTLLLDYAANLTGVNYAFIPDWNRYYYVSSPTIENGTQLIAELHEDCLMSWKTGILNLNATVVRTAQNGKGNLYLDDGKFKILNFPRIQTKKFPNSLSKGLNYVLTIAGGE